MSDKDLKLMDDMWDIMDVLDGQSKKCEPLPITNPSHGGKVTCHKCGGFIKEGEGKQYVNHPHDDPFPPTWFHHNCFNRYEHYYGLDKPID